MKKMFRMMVSAWLIVLMMLSVSALATEGETAAEPTPEPTVLATSQPDETTAPGSENPEQGENTPEPTAAPIEFTGNAYVYLDADGEIFYGDEITLRCEVENANMPYTIGWQYHNGDEWKTIEGEHSKKYEFVVTEKNAEYEYRVVLYSVE